MKIVKCTVNVNGNEFAVDAKYAGFTQVVISSSDVNYSTYIENEQKIERALSRAYENASNQVAERNDAAGIYIGVGERNGVNVTVEIDYAG